MVMIFVLYRGNHHNTKDYSDVVTILEIMSKYSLEDANHIGGKKC